MIVPHYTTMEPMEAKEVVKKLAVLWKEHRKRELLYMLVMKKENLGNLRRLCHQGHISALLFQKELQWVYDYFKCNLNDGDLKELVLTEYPGEFSLSKVEDRGVLIRVLKETEWSALLQYQSVLKVVDRESEVFTILREHLDRLSEFCDRLSNEIIYMSPHRNNRFDQNEPMPSPV